MITKISLTIAFAVTQESMNPRYICRMLKIGKERRAAIVAALKLNPNARQVAQQVGNVSHNTVWRIAKAAGIQLAAGKTAKGWLSPAKREKIIAALKVNPHATQVAQHVGGVSIAAVWNIAKAAGIELTGGHAASRKGTSPEKRATIIAALTDNPNARQVARQVGDASRETVRTIACAAGIELPRRRPRRSQHLVKRGRTANTSADA
jgi:transposase